MLYLMLIPNGANEFESQDVVIETDSLMVFGGQWEAWTNDQKTEQKVIEPFTSTP